MLHLHENEASVVEQPHKNLADTEDIPHRNECDRRNIPHVSEDVHIWDSFDLGGVPHILPDDHHIGIDHVRCTWMTHVHANVGFEIHHWSADLGSSLLFGNFFGHCDEGWNMMAYSGTCDDYFHPAHVHTCYALLMDGHDSPVFCGALCYN